jgi:hypothetical protein
MHMACELMLELGIFGGMRMMVFPALRTQSDGDMEASPTLCHYQLIANLY